MNLLLDDVWPDEPFGKPQRQPAILPTLSLGLDEIFVTAPQIGDFMPVLEVTLLRRGQIKQRPAVFSLS